ALLLIVVALALVVYTPFFNHSGDYEAAIDSSQLITIEKPVYKYGMLVNGMEVKESYVKRNQRFADLFEGSFVKPEILQQLTLLPKDVFNFKKIASSKKYALIHQTDSLKTAVALVYEPNP